MATTKKDDTETTKVTDTKSEGPEPTTQSKGDPDQVADADAKKTDTVIEAETAASKGKDGPSAKEIAQDAQQQSGGYGQPDGGAEEFEEGTPVGVDGLTPVTPNNPSTEKAYLLR